MKKLLVAVLATLGTSVAAFGVTPVEQAAVTRAEQAGTKNWSAQDVADYLPLKRQQDADVPLGERIAHATMLQNETPFQLRGHILNNASTDCVTYVNRAIALAAAKSADEYYKIMYRLLYNGPRKDLATKNHFTEDWIENNRWLLDDVTADLGVSTKTFKSVLRYQKLLEKYDHGQPNPQTGAHMDAEGQLRQRELDEARIKAPPDKTVMVTYIPRENVEACLTTIKSGDVVLIIQSYHKTGLAPWYAITHLGIASIEEGEVGFLQSTRNSDPPYRLKEFVESRASIAGIKVIRPKAHPETVVSQKVAEMQLTVNPQRQIAE